MAAVIVVIVASVRRHAGSAVRVAAELTGAPDAEWASMRDAVVAASRLGGSDPHADERTALLADMTRLNLDTEWAGLPSWSAYANARDGYDTVLGDIAKDFATPARAVRELRQAVASYAGQVKGALAAVSEAEAGKEGPVIGTAEVIGRLDATPGILARCDEQLASRDLAAALAALASTRLPALPSWPPTRQYHTAWDSAAASLRSAAGARGGSAAVTSLGGRVDGGAVADAASVVEARRRQLDEAWDALATAARAVKRDAARSLCDAATSRDAADPVRAAAAVLAVDDVATLNLVQIMRNAVSEPATVPADADLTIRLSAMDKMFAAMDRNNAVLSGIDGVLVPLLAASTAGSGPGLAAAMAQLTPLPAEVAQSWHDVAAFAQHPFQGVSLDAMVTGTMHRIAEGLMHDLGILTSGGHGIAGLAATGMQLHGMLASNLLDSMLEDPEAAVLGVVGLAGRSAGLEYLGEAAKSPLLEHAQQAMELAGHHAGDAALLSAPELLHGVVGHVPFVTLALATTREVRRLHENKTTLDHAIIDVAFDTGSVFAGIGTAELLVHLAAGAHPGFFIQIPATILGSIVARTATKKIREKAYKKAAATYATLSLAYQQQTLALVTDLSDAARNVVGRERSAYLATVGLPELSQRAAAAELQTLTTGLRVATVEYAKVVREVLSADGGAVTGSSRVIGAIAEVPGNAQESAAAAQNGQYASALMTLTNVGLPVPGDWGPSREYRQLCQQTAERVSELADGNREQVARWATGAVASFQRHRDVVGTVITAKSQAMKQELSTAHAAIEAAAKEVERTADAAGIKRRA